MNKFNRDIDKQTICIDGETYSKENINDLKSDDEALNSFYSSIKSFLNEWWKEDETILVHTSGSTGKPKSMFAEKTAMMTSAKNTLYFLNLHKGDTALLCMPMDYIAGKMMVVRALVGGLNLICRVPTGHPLKDLNEKVTFASVIPLQIFNSLSNDSEKIKLMNIREVIVGGGAIDAKVEKELCGMPNNIWSTYGMTETLSHVAMRKLTGSNRSYWYRPLDGIKVSLTTESTLIIDAPEICHNRLITNDIAEVNCLGEFKIIGRHDNIINSGGIKIQIEEVENRLSDMLSFPFMITGKENEKFGSIIVLLAQCEEESRGEIEEICINVLPQYWRPKEIIFIDKLPMTGSGKPDRAAAKCIAKEK